MINVNLKRVNKKTVDEVLALQERVNEIDKMINEKTGAGNDFLGWTTYAKELSVQEVRRMQRAAGRIQKNCDVLVVIGIGGSYLGTKAAIDAINGTILKSEVKVIYLGNTLSPCYAQQVMEYLKAHKPAINVISKSGTTTEPAIALRLALKVMEEVWGDEYYKYVIATTDANRGALHQMAVNKGFEEFVIPDDVGGRFSVFTPVGLLPMAVVGINIDKFIEGVVKGIERYSNPKLLENPAYTYAALRYVEYAKNKIASEFMITYEPHFVALTEWWKQLYGESEGKDGKGLLPYTLCFTTDLHSMGQYCQEGSAVFFETTIAIMNHRHDVEVPFLFSNEDGLNYLAGKKLSKIEWTAITSTLDAHFIEGGHDNVLIEVDEMNACNLGQLFYMFCKACAMSAYLIGVNPFNQPGVEVYKARMKKLMKELD